MSERQTVPLDTHLRVVTAENIAFDYQLAGPFPRALALLIDLVLIGIIVVGLIIVLTTVPQEGIEGLAGLSLICGFFLWWGSGAVQESLMNGQTIGKRCLGLRVVAESGLPINGSQAILRNFLRAADLVPPFFPGLFAMACNRRFQRLGDLAAGVDAGAGDFHSDDADVDEAGVDADAGGTAFVGDGDDDGGGFVGVAVQHRRRDEGGVGGLDVDVLVVATRVDDDGGGGTRLDAGECFGDGLEDLL